MSTSWRQVGKKLVGTLLSFLCPAAAPRFRRAEAIASELTARAEEHGADGLLAEVGNWLAYTKMVSGDFEPAADAWIERGPFSNR